MTIFISHSSLDREVARTLCDALEARGLHCWIAHRDVEAGENFQESIVKAIRAAGVMVLVFTKNANNSGEIKKEIALASQNELVVIPVRIDDVVPNDALSYELATRQWIDLFQDWERAIDRLTARINAVANVGTTAPAAAPVAAATSSVAAPAATPEKAPSDRKLIPAAYATLSLNTHLLAGFLLNIVTFALALMMVFMQKNNFAGAFVAILIALPIGVVIRGLLDKDQNVRVFGLIVGIVGLIAVGAVNGLPYLMHVELLEDESIQRGSLLPAIYFLAATMFFGSEWKKLTNSTRATDRFTAGFMQFMTSPWGSWFVFISSLLFVSVTWSVIYTLTGSITLVLALLACQVAAVAYCCIRFRKDVATAIV
jgi:hypothetical protein